MRRVRPDEYGAVKKALDLCDRNAMLPALLFIPVIPVEAIEFHACSQGVASVLYIHQSIEMYCSRGRLARDGPGA
jgi:hypothetical protein